MLRIVRMVYILFIAFVCKNCQLTKPHAHTFGVHPNLAKQETWQNTVYFNVFVSCTDI